MPAGHKKERGSELIEIFRAIHSAVFWVFVFSSCIIIHAVSYVVSSFIRDEDKKKLFYQKGAILWGSLILKVSLIRVKVSGLENIPRDTNVIYTPNHQSYIDIFILLKYLPFPFKFVIMRKLFKVPVIGRHVTKAGFLSLDRKDRKKSIKTIHKIIDLLKAGRSFVIFVEGKLTLDGNINEFGRGASVIIQQSRKPVIPIAIDGTFSVLPKGAWKLKIPGEVKVTIGKPVYFEDYYDTINRESSMEVGRKLRDIVVKLKG
ncbi:MAG: lysophospholipid acyltransferase family protein [Candidatus Omnitrophota bacterium]|nr:lysophospholipid acyltransferase family protein [Candidatus Omnitrophota bacterium]